LIIAHRGASADAPENTLAAFRLAWQQNADAIEGDFRLTRDGQIVCVHDACMRRYGSTKTIACSTLAELRAFDIGGWKSPEYAGERIATLAEVLAVVAPGKQAYLEIKAGRKPLPALFEALRKTDLPPDRLRLMSFKADVVTSCKRAFPDIPADWLIEYGDSAPPSVETILATLHRCHADGLGTQAWPGVVTPAFGRAVRDSGFSLGCWTVNDERTADAMVAAGVDSVTTDRPAWLRDYLTRQG
jgi:glycerophosphoryl diester phosphodiesterase